jgi:hypothetical protein
MLFCSGARIVYLSYTTNKYYIYVYIFKKTSKESKSCLGYCISCNHIPYDCLVLSGTSFAINN